MGSKMKEEELDTAKSKDQLENNLISLTSEIEALKSEKKSMEEKLQQEIEHSGDVISETTKSYDKWRTALQKENEDLNENNKRLVSEKKILEQELERSATVTHQLLDKLASTSEA